MRMLDWIWEFGGMGDPGSKDECFEGGRRLDWMREIFGTGLH